MLCWCSLNTGREKPLVINIFFFSPLFGSEAFGHVFMFSSYQYCFQMLSLCFFLVCVWIVTWSLALCFWEESLWLGSKQTWTQATTVWPQLPLFEVVFGFKILVWPMATVKPSHKVHFWIQRWILPMIQDYPAYCFMLTMCRVKFCC